MNYPFRLGTTSYIIPDDILPNARYLAGKVRDIELILFEVDDGPNNLPSPEVIEELSQIASQNDMTVTVHLPLDLKLGDDGSTQDQSLIKAKRVIECTHGLNPWAYVLHLDGKAVRTSTDKGLIKQWQDNSVRALEIVSEWVGGAEKLAVEIWKLIRLISFNPYWIAFQSVAVWILVTCGWMGTTRSPICKQRCHAYG
jgi:sugar phosphate isomerase/epimerase